MDSYAGNNQDPITLHKYLLDNADLINGWDPSGFLYEELAVTSLAMTFLTITVLALPLIAASSVLSHAGTRQAVVNLVEDLISSGSAAAGEIYSKIASNTEAVIKAVNNAIDKVIETGEETLEELKKFPIFPVFKSAGPAVYALDVKALAANPAWFVLNYLGPNNPQTEINREDIRALRGGVMATANPGDQLDEYPYASTEQGGLGPPPAWGAPVPAIQNLVQGGLLQAFYRYSLRGRPDTPFLVVPIPL
jgi:hypothetical protein